MDEDWTLLYVIKVGFSTYTNLIKSIINYHYDYIDRVCIPL